MVRGVSPEPEDPPIVLCEAHEIGSEDSGLGKQGRHFEYSAVGKKPNTGGTARAVPRKRASLNIVERVGGLRGGMRGCFAAGRELGFPRHPTGGRPES